jgi:hypothetical protein
LAAQNLPCVVVTVLLREKQTPAGAAETVDGRQWFVVHIRSCHKCHPMRAICVQVDARNIALSAWPVFMALEQGVPAEVIVGISAPLIFKNQINILSGSFFVASTLCTAEGRSPGAGTGGPSLP